MTQKPKKLIVILQESVASSLVKDAGTFLMFGGLMYFNHRILDGHVLIDLVFIGIVFMWLAGRNHNTVYKGSKAGAVKWLQSKD